MQQPSSSYPGDPGQAKRRGLFTGRGAGQPTPSSPGDARLEAMMVAYQQVVTDRLEEGLRAIQQTGVRLMHEIAGEVWRAAGGDKEGVQARILEGLSRDQAIRGLIAHSDERFQALAVRTARLEDTLTTLAETTRALKEVLGRGVQALHDAAASPALQGVEEIRGQLTEVQQHLAATFERIDERDRLLIDSLQERTKEHGSLIHQETGRIVEALEGYVKDGVDAMGRLAGRIDQQAEMTGVRSEEALQRIEQQTELARARSEEITKEITERLTERFEQQTELARARSEEIAQQLAGRFEQQLELTDARSEAIRERLANAVGEQIQMMYERIGLETRALGEAISTHEAWILRTLDASTSRLDEGLEAHVEKVRQASREIAAHMANTIDTRVRGLAELVRSDSEVLRRELRDAAATQSDDMARALDERLGRVSDALTAATRWTVEEMTGRVGRAINDMTRQTGEAIDEAVSRAGENSSRTFQGRMDEVVSAIDRNMVRVADTLDTELDRLGQSVGQRAAQAADAAVGSRFDRTLEKLNAAMESMERMSLRMERIESSTEDAMNRSLDERIGALAKMVRSDNRILAERMQAVADQETAKQALRSVKELQASLPGEMMDVLDRRFSTLAEQVHRDAQATTESMARVSEVLGEKVDRIASQIGERYDRDMQSVIERMGDAMHALASMGRPASTRIELE